MSSKVFEENECGHHLNLSIISHQLQYVSYLTRSGCVTISLHSRYGDHKANNPNSMTLPGRYQCLNGMWVGVAPRMDIVKICV